MLRYLIFVLFLSFAACSPQLPHSLSAVDFQPEKVKEITLLHQKVIMVEQSRWFERIEIEDDEDIKFADSTIHKEFEHVFQKEGIKIIVPEKNIYSDSSQKELDIAMMDMTKAYLSKEKRKAGVIDVHPEFDFNEKTQQITTDLGLYFSFEYDKNKVYSSSVGSYYIFTNSVGIPVFSSPGRTITGMSTISVFLIDVKTGEIKWEICFEAHILPGKLVASNLLKSIIMSLKYGRDFHPATFELEFPTHMLNLEDVDGNKYQGFITETDGFIIKMDSRGTNHAFHMSQIKLIRKLDSQTNIFPIEIN